MKVLLLGFSKIAFMPYINYYLDCLEDHEVDLIYWERDAEPDSPVPAQIKNAYVYRKSMADDMPFIKKLPFFAGFRRYTLGVLNKNRYDLIITQQCVPCLTLSRYLCLHYKRRFILDYRDFSHEDIGLYKKLAWKLARNAKAVFISSAAFRMYLPPDIDAVVTHNVQTDSLKHRDIRAMFPRSASPIRIRYWGLIRHTDINLEMIRKLGNDSRFELHYHGREQETGLILRQYCDAHQIKNVFFHGVYSPEERYVFASQTDILHNIFEPEKVMVNAMSNKYYDGIVFCLPQLCEPNSYMGEVLYESGIGLPCSPYDDDFADQIAEYYEQIDWRIFACDCDRELNRVLAEYGLSLESFRSFANEIEQAKA